MFHRRGREGAQRNHRKQAGQSGLTRRETNNSIESSADRIIDSTSQEFEREKGPIPPILALFSDEGIRETAD